LWRIRGPALPDAHDGTLGRDLPPDDTQANPRGERVLVAPVYRSGGPLRRDLRGHDPGAFGATNPRHRPRGHAPLAILLGHGVAFRRPGQCADLPGLPFHGTASARRNRGDHPRGPFRHSLRRSLLWRAHLHWQRPELHGEGDRRARRGQDALLLRLSDLVALDPASDLCGRHLRILQIREGLKALIRGLVFRPAGFDLERLMFALSDDFQVEGRAGRPNLLPEEVHVGDRPPPHLDGDVVRLQPRFLGRASFLDGDNHDAIAFLEPKLTGQRFAYGGNQDS